MPGAGLVPVFLVVGVVNEMPVFPLFPSDVVGDCIGIVFEMQEGISQASNGIADCMEGMCKWHGPILGVPKWSAARKKMFENFLS